ncbi:diguanylate cyclase/phosphodiesterase [Rhodopseudomonas thermotolerans]|uniref:Diguanylate cyclase/phosphodiesterase n=2 Tax=Rhodopseudomonas TaxID=1073 RepID=A0A336JIW8_9BRAD|nr:MULTISPECIES: EAL domain-containing protein [Rhodopseudomonas]RED41992.1 diguanylate cyclase/phosphodiesterase [Rhodopseudomonas pentothenatexigens]REG07453.1 diguanylate cyclase/phosphodiesterase [Rhodopseudomonas thermotolerans]SSW89352.1 diguanylate cyclase/phosphodiesterase [Rhodopseudomonas pentothenatexigens]
MSAAVTQISENPINQLASDLTVLQRKWYAAIQPGQSLPSYEEVMLGSLGRLADHLVLLEIDGETPEVSRTGRYAQQWLGDERWDIPLDALSPDCGTALAQAASGALQNKRPHLGTAHCVRDGIVQRYTLLALPTASRWGGTLVGVYVNEERHRYNLLDAIFSSTDDGIVALTAIRGPDRKPFDFQIVHVNSGASELLGRSVAALRWSRLSVGHHLLCTPDVAGRLIDLVDSDSSITFAVDSGDRNLSLSATAFGDVVSVTISDVTSLKKREESFRLLFDGNPMPMWVFDAQTFEFLSVNDAAVAHYGYPREQFLRMSLREIWPREEWIAHGQTLLEMRDSYQSEGNWRHVKADGSEIHVLTFGRRVVFDGRDGFLVAVVDITERRKAEAKIAHMAHHDGLTNLPNRALYQQRLEQALAQARGSGTMVAVMCVDLDLFKNVNDSFGHPTGDRLLQCVAERLRQQVGDGDLVARLGGDEFAIVLTSLATPNEAGSFAARLIEILSAPYDMDGLEVVIGASIGIALAPSDGDECEALSRNADMALYRAKAAGGGCHHFFEKEMDRQAQIRRDMELDLRQAFARGEFELHYQPLIDLAEDRIGGFETLLRWRHPERGMISPSDFIPVAEDIGLIVGLGEWVLRQACLEAASWPSDVKVAVNLSPVQFRSRNLVQVVISALAQSSLVPHRLELEITESLFLADSEANLATLHQLRSLGVRISMDDFGTGYSSLSYLRSFPFDKIKIDRSFVKDLAERPDCLAIVRAIAGLGRSLDITTLAEGVETVEQLDALRAEGCHEVQGFLFSPARPSSEIHPLLTRFGRQASKAA